ncbi:MAG: hypothetical protein JWP88_1009 [Flaviaesturariibacter sp.]|nr:hypothetical protein [Flaviaesturariibacter sp.]
MSQRNQTLELVALNAMLIQKNKEFIQAMTARRPHKELVSIYNQVKDIYAEMGQLQQEDLLQKVA